MADITLHIPNREDNERSYHDLKRFVAHERVDHRTLDT